jgi:galactokinase/mevalonate kinase-like predicted kinase
MLAHRAPSISSDGQHVIEVTLPARINIVGSPTDAVEGAYATVSAAIDLCGGARIEPAEELIFRRSDGSSRTYSRDFIQHPRGFAIEEAAVNAFLRHCPDLKAKFRACGVAITTWTDVPASSGLAGSSVLLLAVLAGLRAHYEIDPIAVNDYVLAEIAQRAEEHDMGVVCGFADRYVPLFGDIAYLSYHGKLWHAPLGDEPFVTYEKLGEYCPALSFCVATTGVRRDSGAVHAPMRQRYLAERRGRSGTMLDLSRAIGETAWRGKIALLAGDLEELGRLIDRNQELVDEMMRSCGFEAGAGKEVGILVRAARVAGALGAKLTGAGGGGAVFALPRPGDEEKLAAALRAAARESGLRNSEVFIVPVTRRGLRVERSDP